MDGLSPSFTRTPRRLLGAVAAVVLALCAASSARADDAPATRWPAGGAALGAAMGLAATHWGLSPCAGRVTVAWASLPHGVNARSSWANDVDPYTQPSRNSDCAIALNQRVEWDWPMLCTVVVHEAGHLTGHDHVDDPRDVMYYAYVAPAPECAATPEPTGAGPAPPAPPRPAAKAKAARPKAKARPRSQRAPARSQRRR